MDQRVLRRAGKVVQSILRATNETTDTNISTLETGEDVENVREIVAVIQQMGLVEVNGDNVRRTTAGSSMVSNLGGA
jgi:predicted methyltransferase